VSQTVSDHLLACLAANGVRRIYGYPGDGINGIMGALDRAGGAIGDDGPLELIQVRHEEMAAFMRVGPVAITNGRFGNRPHCIYRGFCLQGCKVNAKASPLVTHVPDALEHGVEIRADSMVTRIGRGHDGACTGVTYMHHGRERCQRASAVAVAGYAIETPRLLLNSGVGNDFDQVGRYVMVQGAPQVTGPFAETQRMYKGPPPEVCSEQFYETDEARGFAIQTVSPLPIRWAEHVLADGHWGTIPAVVAQPAMVSP